MNIVSSRTLIITFHQTNERTFAFLELLTEPKLIGNIILESELAETRYRICADDVKDFKKSRRGGIIISAKNTMIH